jgi:hypothetical protein
MAIRMTIAVPLFFAVAVAAGAQTQPQTLDHFRCYFTESGLLPLPLPVQLEDQFDAAVNKVETIKDLRLLRLCNPVQKTTVNGTVTPITNGNAHLTMYQIPPEPITPRLVVVRNQFGLQGLRTGPAIILAVPTAKFFMPPPTTAGNTPPSVPAGLDHFKCYTASGRNIDAAVNLKDQFGTSLAVVLQPAVFCNPVQKTVPNPNPSTANGGPVVTPITNPTAHLTCYVTTQTNFPAQQVFILNQFTHLIQPNPPFAQGPLVVVNPELLCVPSLKLRWIVIPPITVFPPVRGAELVPGLGDDDDQGGDR